LSTTASRRPAPEGTPPRLHIALIHPEIPQNTGNIGRLCLGLGARLHLVHPLGFQVDAKAVRRAGIDHWRRVDLQEHEQLCDFTTWARGRRLHAFTRHASRSLAEASFLHGDVLLFGPESTGLPEPLRSWEPAWRIPIPGPVRSLNLSNAVAVAAYSALAQLEPALFRGEILPLAD